MKRSILLSTLLFSFVYMPAQAGLADMLRGEWVGGLEYLDYTDNETRVSLPTSLTITGSDGKLRLKFAYVEPNGKILRSKDKVKVAESFVEWGGIRWEVVSVEGEPEAEGGWRMVIQTEGSDDDRPATLRQTIVRKKSELTLLKEVRYDPADDFTFRNVYRFNERAPTLEKD